MTAKSKRIIAREFLICVICISAGIIAFGGTFVYNLYIGYAARSVLDEAHLMIPLADSLEKPYLEKREARLDFYSQSSVSNLYNDDSQMWDRLLFLSSKDSISYKWINTWDESLKASVVAYGIDGPAEFKTFIEANRITGTDADSYNESVELRKKSKALFFKGTEIIASKMSLDGQIHFTLLVTLILLCLLFPIRFFIMGITWSVKTLKQG